jgi:outer membrane receptor for ferrienterochelin and colicin
MFQAPLVTALLSLALTACIAPNQVPGPMPDLQLITEDEIVQSHAMTAYDAIQHLRGNFLHLRGTVSLLGTSSPYPTVYVDGMRYGSIDALRSIPAVQIATIRLYRAWDAETRYGSNNMGGVIAVTTRLDRATRAASSP